MNMIRHIENMPRWFKDMIVVLLKPANMLYNYGEYDIKLRMGNHVPGLKDTKPCNVGVHAEVFKYPTINGVPLEGIV